MVFPQCYGAYREHVQHHLYFGCILRNLLMDSHAEAFHCRSKEERYYNLRNFGFGLPKHIQTPMVRSLSNRWGFSFSFFTSWKCIVCSIRKSSRLFRIGSNAADFYRRIIGNAYCSHLEGNLSSCLNYRGFRTHGSQRKQCPNEKQFIANARS